MDDLSVNELVRTIVSQAHTIRQAGAEIDRLLRRLAELEAEREVNSDLSNPVESAEARDD